MNKIAHLKTIGVIILSIAFLALLFHFPALAFAVWIGMWVIVGLLGAGWIYGMIYMCFDSEVPTPTPQNFYFYGVYNSE